MKMFLSLKKLFQSEQADSTSNVTVGTTNPPIDNAEEKRNRTSKSQSRSPSHEEKISHNNKSLSNLIEPVRRKNSIVGYQCLSIDKESGFPCLRTCSSLDKIKAHLEYCRKL